MDVSDGDLVGLARDGDAAAFRLLVERYRPLARARAARLCSRSDDVDDIVQESFLQAFVALDRLRDPDRFGAWLGGIVVNVHRAMARRASPTLLADWPEQLHSHSADGLPSADDLDRSEVLRQAVAELPVGQRRAVAMFYYADLPAGQISDSPGAAKSSLHKARRRLRDYISAHRPDLIPAAYRRSIMTPVRIAHAEARPGMLGDDMFYTERVLVVLADDAGGRALPIWLRAFDGQSVRVLLDRPAGYTGMAVVPEELTDRLLRAAGVTVTAVDIDELGPEVAAARIELGTPTGTRHVTARLADGLALAAAAGAPVRVADPVMDRLAVPVGGDDLLGPFIAREPAAAERERGLPRRQARNLAFTDGLDGWRLRGNFLRDVSGSHWQDYSCAVEDQSAILFSAVPEPYGYAHLGQEILARDYRGRTLVFTGDLRAKDVAHEARLYVRVHVEEPTRAIEYHHSATVTGSHDWAGHQVTAQVPEGAIMIRFGLTLTGRGRVELRNAELTCAS
ncbi:MAG TPA: sigma-70 family RNA polymerase sigma factor [Streptosporangiaceae bacterium]